VRDPSGVTVNRHPAKDTQIASHAATHARVMMIDFISGEDGEDEGGGFHG